MCAPLSKNAPAKGQSAFLRRDNIKKMPLKTTFYKCGYLIRFQYAVRWSNARLRVGGQMNISAQLSATQCTSAQLSALLCSSWRGSGAKGHKQHCQHRAAQRQQQQHKIVFEKICNSLRKRYAFFLFHCLFSPHNLSSALSSAKPIAQSKISCN